jgi:hypothetical protein
MSPPHLPSPLALVVGFSDSRAAAIAGELARMGLRTCRAPTGPAASERAHELRPSLIVASRDLWSAEIRALASVADALAARIVYAA